MSWNRENEVAQPAGFGGKRGANAQAGDVISVIGASGSGKSTFLRCIDFLERPSAGTISFDGEVLRTVRDGEGMLRPVDSRQLRRIQTRLSMVFQNSSASLLRFQTQADDAGIIAAPEQSIGGSRSILPSQKRATSKEEMSPNFPV